MRDMAEGSGRVAVIGAGIVGVACALELQRAGRSNRQNAGTSTLGQQCVDPHDLR